MTEYERGYKEALEAAARRVETATVQFDDGDTGPMRDLANRILTIFRPGLASAIRALAPRIPPAKPCHCRLTVGVPGRVCDGAGCIPPAPDAAIERLTRERDEAAFERDAAASCMAAAENARTAAEAERDALREALSDLLSWFPEAPRREPVWLLQGGEQGADDAIAHARAALGGKP